MDVVIAEDAAAGPQERMEQPDLVHQFGDALRLRRRPCRRPIPCGSARIATMSPICPSRIAAEQFLPRAAVPHHQPDPDLQVLPPRLFAQLRACGAWSGRPP